MIKSLQLVFVYFVIAVLVGSIPVKVTNEKQSGLLKTILYGSVIMFVLFDMLVIVMTIMGQSLTLLTQIWAVLIGIASVLSAIIAKGFLFEQIKKLPMKLKSFTYLDGVLIILIGIQIVVCVKYVFLHSNDAYYVGMATTTLNTDRLLSYSPYTGVEINWIDYKTHLIASLPVFWAMLAKLFGVSGALMCHSIIPIIFIPIGYILYREIGLLLFKQDKRVANLFVIILCFSNFFIGKNYDSSYELLSTSIWQGGTFLYNIALPGVFYFEFKFLRRNRKIMDLIMLFMMLILGTMTVPVSGFVLSGFVLLILGFSFTVEKLLTRRKRMDAGINI
jgi:Family of unknown function (DUF6077)